MQNSVPPQMVAFGTMEFAHSLQAAQPFLVDPAQFAKQSVLSASQMENFVLSSTAAHNKTQKVCAL